MSRNMDDGSNVLDKIELEYITPDNLPLAFVKQYLRIDEDFTDDDLEISLAIVSAQHYVRNYVRVADGEFMDVGLLPIVLSVVAYFYENKSPLMKSTEKIDAMFSSILNLYREDIL